MVVVDRPEVGSGAGRAATGWGAGAVERLQRDLAEGPALEARRTGRVQVSADLAVEARWRRLSAAVGQTGMRSALCVPLAASGVVLGHVGAYAAVPDAFGDRERHLAVRWSGAAVRECAEALRADEDRRALRLHLDPEQRAEVDRAFAVLAADQGVGTDEALAVLVLMARAEQQDLVAVCRAVVAEGIVGRPAPGG